MEENVSPNSEIDPNLPLYKKVPGETAIDVEARDITQEEEQERNAAIQDAFKRAKEIEGRQHQERPAEIIPEQTPEPQTEQQIPDYERDFTQEEIDAIFAPMNSGKTEVKEEEEKEKEEITEPEKESRTPAAQEIQTESGANWKESVEWQEFTELREELVKAEVALDADKTRELSEKYEALRDSLAERMKEELWNKQEITPTPEQEVEIDLKIKKEVFEELVVKEREAYFKLKEDSREETWKDKAKAGLIRVFNTKVGQWWIDPKNKWKRLAITTTLFTLGGYALGTVAAGGTVLGAAGYGAGRMARGAASILAGGAARVAAEKRWSIEDIDKEAKEREEKIKKMDISLEEKSRMFDELKSWEAHEKKRAKIKKGIVTFGVGAGAGLLAGLTEGVALGRGTSSNVLESKGGRASDIAENKLPPRQGFVPNSEQITPKVGAETIQETAQNTEISSPEPAADSAPNIETEKIFDSPEILRHDVVAGDSAWKILEKTLDHNEQFKGMTEAQKTYVLSALTNKVMGNPESYGLNSDGSLDIGDKTDFAKLFEDTKEIKSIFGKAEQTVQTGGPQEDLILKNNQKIENWVKEHPNESLSEEKISEILNSKPEEKIIAPEPVSPKPMSPEPEFKTANQLEEEALTQHVTEPDQVSSPESGGVKGVTAEEPNEAAVHQEIAEAKQRLAELEKTRNPNLERTLASDSKSRLLEIELKGSVEKAFDDEIDSIYGEKGFWGFGKVKGVDSGEWKEMARLPANKVLEYYTSDSTNSGLPDDIVEKLAKSANHGSLLRQTIGLMEQASGAVRPFENENMEQFIKRLGGYILKTHLQAQRAA